MTSRDFVYWLQGFFEVSGIVSCLDTRQVELVRRHLAMVFVHEIDPSMGDKAHQEALTQAHQGGVAPTKPPKPPKPQRPDREGPILYRC